MSGDDQDATGEGVAAAESAARFARVREAHQSELAEDYVEMIDDLIREKGEARLVDLAGRFGVAPGTVTRTVQRLTRDGLVISEPYRAIHLTEEGRRIACDARARHELVRATLVALGVPESAADADAEGIEHHVGKETLAAFRRYLATRR